MRGASTEESVRRRPAARARDAARRRDRVCARGRGARASSARSADKRLLCLTISVCAGIVGAWPRRSQFDVLVVGSGASGLAAAVSADRAGARGRARDEGRAPVLQLREGAGRHPGRVRRRRLARAARRGRLDAASHETADMRLVEVLTGEAPSRDPLARGARRRVHARERRLPARALRRRDRGSGCSRSATAPATRSRRRCATRSRGRHPARLPNVAAARARAARRTAGARAAASTMIDAGDGRPRRRRPLLPRWREERGELTTNHPGATGEVTQIARRARRRGARPRRAPVPPERRRVAAEHAGLLDPRDDARLRRRPA